MPLFAVAGQILSRNTTIALGTLLIWTAGMAAEPPAQTGGLRVSHTLEPRRAPDESERALLRLEARVGRTLHDDRAVISDLLARINRMTIVVADIHKLLTDMPVGEPCKQVAAPCTTTTASPAPPGSPATPAAPASPPATSAMPAGREPGDTSEILWPTIIGSASILGLLVLWLARRRRTSADAVFNTVNVVSVPGNGTMTKSPPKAAPRPQANGTAPTSIKPSAPEQAAPARTVSIRPRPAQPPIAPPAPTPAKGLTDAKPEGASDMSLELAEVMLSMGLTDGAAQTLSDHIRHHPRQALFHWLKLLDVYRQSGMKAEFEKAASELQQHFNMAPPDWIETQQAAGAKKVEKLEDFPHIAGRVQELWPHRTCAEYLNRLLEDTRGGTRAGFPKPVVEEILLLLSLLKD